MNRSVDALLRLVRESECMANAERGEEEKDWRRGFGGGDERSMGWDAGAIFEGAGGGVQWEVFQQKLL